MQAMDYLQEIKEEVRLQERSESLGLGLQLMTPTESIHEAQEILESRDADITMADLSKALEIPTTPVVEIESVFADSPLLLHAVDTTPIAHGGSDIGLGFLPASPVVQKLRSNSYSASINNNMTYHFNATILSNVADTTNTGTTASMGANSPNPNLLSPRSLGSSFKKHVVQRGASVDAVSLDLHTREYTAESPGYFDIGDSKRNSLQKFRSSLNIATAHSSSKLLQRRNSRASISASSPMSNLGYFEDYNHNYTRSRKGSIASATTTVTQRNTSLGSNVRRSLSKIASTTGTIKRAFSSASLNANNAKTANPEGNSNDNGFHETMSHSFSRMSQNSGRNSVADVRNGMFNLHISRENSAYLEPNTISDDELSNSSSTFTNKMLLEDGYSLQNSTPVENWSNTGFVGIKSQGNYREDRGEDDKFLVDIDKLTTEVPVISVTDRLGSKNSTPLIEQSSIVNAEVKCKGRNRNNSNASSLASGSTQKMGLDEYIKVLIGQQNLEDERLEYLEKRFKECGWCSEEELQTIRRKRVMINRKWANKISRYQNKLEL